MQVYLDIAQITISVVLTALVLLQVRSRGLGTAFGGDSSIYQTRRGLERTLFNWTIVFAALFLVVAFINVLQS
jgi:preprotein translocase subunit SecG